MKGQKVLIDAIADLKRMRRNKTATAEQLADIDKAVAALLGILERRKVRKCKHCGGTGFVQPKTK